MGLGVSGRPADGPVETEARTGGRQSRQIRHHDPVRLKIRPVERWLSRDGHGSRECGRTFPRAPIRPCATRRADELLRPRGLVQRGPLVRGLVHRSPLGWAIALSAPVWPQLTGGTSSLALRVARRTSSRATYGLEGLACRGLKLKPYSTASTNVSRPTTTGSSHKRPMPGTRRGRSEHFVQTVSGRPMRKPEF